MGEKYSNVTLYVQLRTQKGGRHVETRIAEE